MAATVISAPEEQGLFYGRIGRSPSPPRATSCRARSLTAG